MKQTWVIMSSKTYRASVRLLRVATSNGSPYSIPRSSLLSVARLESALFVLEEHKHVRQRAVWVRISDRECATLYAFLGWALADRRPLPPSARPLRERLAQHLGLA